MPIPIRNMDLKKNGKELSTFGHTKKFNLCYQQLEIYPEVNLQLLMLFVIILTFDPLEMWILQM